MTDSRSGWSDNGPADAPIGRYARRAASIQAGSEERKGASYSIKGTRSHDYGGTEQSTHSTRPITPISRRSLKREEIADEVARGEHREDY